MSRDDVTQAGSQRSQRLWKRLCKLGLPVVAGAFAFWQTVPDGTRSKVIESAWLPVQHPPPTASGAQLLLERARSAQERCDFRDAERVLTLAQQEKATTPEIKAQVLLGLADLALRTRYLPIEVTGYLDAVDALTGGSSELRQWAAVRRGELSLRQRKLDAASSSYEQVGHDPSASLAALSSAQLGLAQVAAAQGDEDGALQLLARAEQGLASTGDTAGVAEVSLQRGIIFKMREAWPQAYAAYRNALELYARQPCKHPKQCFVYCALGDLRQIERIGDEDARQLYQRGLALANELSFDVGRAHSLLGLALLDQQEGAFKQARDHFHEALIAFQNAGDIPRQARVHQLWSALCHDGHDTDCEQKHSQMAARLYAELRGAPDAGAEH